MSKFQKFKKVIACFLVTAICFSSIAVDAYAASYTSSKSDTDTDKSFSTEGTLKDSTNLNIYYNDYWWYSKASVKTKGISKFVFNKKSTSYSTKLIEHTLSSHMSGLSFSTSVGSTTNISCTIKDNIATYSTNDAYFSYSFTTYASCWNQKYRQESSVKYKIMNGNSSKGTVMLTTTITW